VRSFQHLVLEYLKGIDLRLVELPIGLDALLDHLDLTRSDNFLIKVFNQCLDKRSAYAFDAFFEPDVVMEEFSFASKDTKFDSEVVVVAVYYFDEAVFDLLGDVKYP
jgi:hypothetical protein